MALGVVRDELQYNESIQKQEEFDFVLPLYTQALCLPHSPTILVW